MKNRIRVFRAMYSLTQEDLATRIGVTRRTINAIERGQYNPSIEVAFRLAQLFGVPIEEVFTYDGEPMTPLSSERDRPGR